MGGLKLTHGWHADRKNLFLLMHRMVPPSVTELEIVRDTFEESYWREFVRLRPEVRSATSSYEAKALRLNRLWHALLPNRRCRSATPFPKLKSSVLKAEHLSMIPLLVMGCLRMRSKVGLKLKHLELQDTGNTWHTGR